MTAADALQPAIIYLGAGLASAFASRAARLSPLVGYLLVGVVIGPYGAKLVEENATSAFLAELGVVFLMFDIGLHFSLKDIQSRGTDILRLAPLQIVLCGAGFAGVGLALGFPVHIAVLIGASLALSSTAVVSRILADRGLPGCPMGRSATAVLVAQDVAAIFLLALGAQFGAPAQELGMNVMTALAKAVAAFAIAVALGRFVVRPLFRSLAATNNEEAFTVVALFVVLAASAATARADLSLTLGAFLAGMAIADTAYRHVVETEVKPFQGLLLGLFFISVGMHVDLPALPRLWLQVVLATAVITGLKTVLVYLSARLNGWAPPKSTQIAFLLSQGSEFTLVFLATAEVAAGLPDEWPTVLVTAVSLSLAIAPMWSMLGMRLARILANRAKADAPSPAPAARVLVFGMTEEGRFAVDALQAHNISYVALDSDPNRFVAATSDGYDVIYGDAADFRLMDSIGARDARAVVLGAERFAVSQSVTPAIQERYPNLTRFVAVTTPEQSDRHRELGMRAHYSNARPRGVELAADLLTHLGLERGEVAAWIEGQVELHNRDRSEPLEDDDELQPAAA